MHQIFGQSRGIGDEVKMHLHMSFIYKKEVVRKS